MRASGTDKDWEHFAESDPYWAVLTQERFKKQNLDAGARRDFFASGQMHVRRILETIRSCLDAGYSPRRALDFGCGVGRILVPLARACEEVVGVDVAETMLQEAQAVLDAEGLGNVTLVKGDDHLSRVKGPFDLVHSYIVLQHIPCVRGQRLFRRLVELVGEGGVGVIHLTYSKERFGKNLGLAWPRSSTAEPGNLRCYLWGLTWAIRRRLRRARRALRRIGRPNHPVMQMNCYTLNPLFHVLQASRIGAIHAEFTEHGKYYGVEVFFQKPMLRNKEAAPETLR